MRTSNVTFLPLLALFALAPSTASCGAHEENRPPRAPTRQLPLEVVTTDTPDAPPVMQATRGKNGTGKDHEAEFATPAAVSHPAAPPPPPSRPSAPPPPPSRPAPPPRR